MGAIEQELERFIEWAWKLNTHGEYEQWTRRLFAFLDGAGLYDDLKSSLLYSDGDSPQLYWQSHRDKQASLLLGYVSRLGDLGPQIKQSAPAGDVGFNARSVFLVHGHDSSAKESTARFLEKLRLEVVILHERP